MSICSTVVCLSFRLSVCSLVPSIGKTESVAASSCKEARDILSNECFRGPQSGTYWITVTDPCTQHNRTMRVGVQHTCLRNYKVIVGICLKEHRLGYTWGQHLYTVFLLVPPLQVYCDMDLNGGGWTMVWKHSYMEVLPLTTAMYYFSQHHRECSDMEAGWCNIPNKGHLQPTHMMIAAYHNKNVVWAYKGWFNWNIDHDWMGGVLVEPTQVVDRCS